MSMAIITIVFPPEQRGRGMAFYGMGTSMGGTAGPAVGGYMVDNFSWRLIFYINVILGVAGLVACLTILKSDQDRVKERFDYLGFITLSFLIVSLLVALSQGNVKGWNSYYTLGLFLIFIASFSAWIYTESIVARPLIDLGIFRNKHFMVGTIVSFMVGICLFGSNFLMPLFMARLLDYSIFRISLALVPGVLLSIFTTRIGGFLTDAFSPRLPTILGLILWALFAYAFSLMDMRASFVVITLVILLRGSGLGLSYTPSMTGAMLSLPTRFLAVAAGLLSLAFTLGGMFGIAILGTMLENRELTHYSNYTENYDQTSYAAGQALNSLQSFFAGLGHTGAEAKGLAIGLLRGMVSVEAVVSAFQDSFILLSITALATIGIAVFLHKK
jgi:DHA2 family multidrug resistance protein